jgi:hypothetical protein
MTPKLPEAVESPEAKRRMRLVVTSVTCTETAEEVLAPVALSPSPRIHAIDSDESARKERSAQLAAEITVFALELLI